MYSEFFVNLAKNIAVGYRKDRKAFLTLLADMAILLWCVCRLIGAGMWRAPADFFAAGFPFAVLGGAALIALTLLVKQ